MFTGFPKEALTFFKGLKKNNNKTWFHKNKAQYDQAIMEPARAFVEDMGHRLMSIAPHIYAEPQVNRSIYRINRDIRFSKDKTPYKTHLALWFWEGGNRKEATGFYFGLSDDHVFVGAGMHCFSKPILEEYQQSLVSKRHGDEFSKIAKHLEKKGYILHGERYKRVPRGFDPDHKNAEYLKHKGLYVGIEQSVPKEVHSDKLLDYAFKHYKAVAPLHEWLLGVSKRSGKK